MILQENDLKNIEYELMQFFLMQKYYHSFRKVLDQIKTKSYYQIAENLYSQEVDQSKIRVYNKINK